MIDIFRIIKNTVAGDAPTIRLSDRECEEKRRSVALSVGSILLVLLVLSVGFGWKHRIDSMREANLSESDQRVRFAIEQATSLATLSPGRARAMILGAKTDIEQERSETKDARSRSRLSDLSKELDNALVSTGRVMNVSPELYLDLELIREGAKGSVMALSGKHLLVFDQVARVAMSISATDRGGEVIGGGDALSAARAVAGFQDQAFILTDHDVIQIDVDRKINRTVISDDEGIWSDPTDIASFSGNIYILDRGVSEVYKYAPLKEAFGSRRRWFAPGITPNLADVRSFAVDGDAWFLLPSGVVKRFHQGVPVAFSQSGADEFGEAVSFSVPEGGTRIWILDRQKGIVIAFSRDNGEYAGQWVSDVMKSAISIAVSEELGKMFLLAGEKIYMIGIK